MTIENLDIEKLIRFLIKRIWIPILCAIIGFGIMYWRAEHFHVDTYTAKGTMYIYNNNPSIVNYQYTNTGDLDAAVKIADLYKVVVRSNKVTEAVAERLGNSVDAGVIASSVSMSTVSDTGVTAVSCTTQDPQLSMDICNAVMDIAPAEIIRVVNAGSVEIIDYATLPLSPNAGSSLKQGMTGALGGAVIAAGLLLAFFLFNSRLGGSKELTDNYKLPLLASILKQPEQEDKRGYLINEHSPSQLLAGYGKLRMNLAFAMHSRFKTVIITSALPGESKSVLSANLAISQTMDKKHVLLVDADMRKPTQYVLFDLPKKTKGLSDALAAYHSGGEINIQKDVRPGLDLLTAGTVPPNPSELLNSAEMRELLKKFEQDYDIVLLDMPPINVVPDPLVLSDANVGVLYITRSGYSDHKEIRKALASAELTSANMLGMVMTCAERSSDGYYSYRYYRKYYGVYDDNRSKSRRHHKHRSNEQA